MKRCIATVAALVLTLAGWSAVQAEGDGAVAVQVRVWQDAHNAGRLFVSGRAEGGSWSTLGTVRLTLDESGSGEGRQRYRSVTVLAPLPDLDPGATGKVEVRIEQDLAGGGFLVSARSEGSPWGEAAAAPLSLDTLTSRGLFRYGDVSLTAPVSAPSQRHLELKRYMLQLINAARSEAGVDPVILGDNDAAQLHAEASLAGCYSSHWGIDGLKPYMRYSLTGGYQANAENGLGLDYCITSADRYIAITNLRQAVAQAVESWKGSPGHLANILDPWHRVVTIGLAWDRYNFRAVQNFEGDYLEYDGFPTIEDGRLRLSGTVKNGVRFSQAGDLHLRINYDPPPYTLALGQVTRTYCYDSGAPAAGLRPPLPPNRRYLADEVTRDYQFCPDPYDVPADAAAPATPREASEFWEAARDAAGEAPDVTLTYPWITAEEWTADGTAFSVSVDLSDLLAEHGPGVYTILAWGPVDGEFVMISQYSIFHGVQPPEGYLEHR